MGCDIHVHIEVKIKGEWQHYNHPTVQACYPCFAKLADVRNKGGIEPISQPKGLPDDITLVTRTLAKAWELDGHSHSWLDSVEIAEFCRWYEAQDQDVVGRNTGAEQWLHTYLNGSSLDIYEFPQDKPEWAEDVRLVFWFDC